MVACLEFGYGNTARGRADFKRTWFRFGDFLWRLRNHLYSANSAPSFLETIHFIVVVVVVSVYAFAQGGHTSEN